MSSKSIQKAKDILSSREATRVQKNHAASVLLRNGWSPEVVKAVAAKGADPESRKRYWHIFYLKRTVTDPKSTAQQKRDAAEKLLSLGVKWADIVAIARAHPVARKLDERVAAHGTF